VNKLLASFCAGLTALGLLVVVGCVRQAAAQGGWTAEAECPDGPWRLPLDWAAFGGVSCVLLGPLFYFAGRSSREGDRG